MMEALKLESCRVKAILSFRGEKPLTAFRHSLRLSFVFYKMND